VVELYIGQIYSATPKQYLLVTKTYLDSCISNLLTSSFCITRLILLHICCVLMLFIHLSDLM